MSYKIKVYSGDRKVNTCFVDDWKVVRDNSWSTVTYTLMTRRPEFVGWQEAIYICCSWGFKVFDENNNLVCSMGQVDGEWIQPHVARSRNLSNTEVLYIDEYADQPDAI